MPELTSTIRNRTPHRLYKRLGWICAAACFSLISQVAAQPLSVAVPQVGGDPGQLPRFEQFDECCFFGPPHDENDLCGFVVVPLARDADGRASGAGVLYLAVMAKQQEVPSKAPPLIVTYGGPGGSVMGIGFGAELSESP